MTKDLTLEEKLTEVLFRSQFEKKSCEDDAKAVLTLLEQEGIYPPGGWKKTTEELPSKPNEDFYVDCLIFHKGEVKQRPWNAMHHVWDDEHYDDYFCDPTEPTHWMPLPSPPVEKEG